MEKKGQWKNISDLKGIAKMERYWKNPSDVLSEEKKVHSPFFKFFICSLHIIQ